MNRFTTLRAAAALAGCTALLPAAAFAQDTGGMGQVYVRGDVGASFSDGTSGDIYHGNGFGQDFGRAFMFDGGFGFNAGTYSGMALRFDATLGYRAGREGFHSAANAAGNTTLSTTTKVDTLTLFGNGYIDIPTSLPVTPYVGGGLGMAENRLHGLSYLFNNTAGATETGETMTNFAWQLMGGFSAPVSHGVFADVAYHYVDTGAVRSGGSVTLANGVNSSQPPVQSNMHAHEITVGLRVVF